MSAERNIFGFTSKNTFILSNSKENLSKGGT